MNLIYFRKYVVPLCVRMEKGARTAPFLVDLKKNVFGKENRRLGRRTDSGSS